MKPYYQDNSVQIYNGNCLDILPSLEVGSVQCVITSPPYWGLRKYAGEQDIVWGDNHCGHEWGKEILRKDRGTAKGATAVVGNQLREISGVDTPQGQFCQLCGSWRGAYGLEPTPEMYVQHTIEILRTVRRVLRKDGVVFWNIGDTYFGSGCGTNDYRTPASISLSKPTLYDSPRPQNKRQHSTLKPKDLTLIPFRVAIAAQEDGWWVRSVIIWSKSNPMPESVQDRPTESHEYILMLTKANYYYWDIEAVREPHTITFEEAWRPGKLDEFGNRTGYPDKRDGTTQSSMRSMKLGQDKYNPAGRNLRTVWEITTQPYPEAHFATFPEKIPERCILAATSEKGNCSKCGKPWVRIVKSEGNPSKNFSDTDVRDWSNTHQKTSNPQSSKSLHRNEGGVYAHTETLGWKPQCHCEAPSEPPVVLDPFVGSGTTLWVAKRLGRRAIGIDTSSQYCDLAIERNRQQAMTLPTHEGDR